MDHPQTDPLASLVAAVVDLGGPLASVVAHMRAHEAAGRTAVHAPPIPEALAMLLTEVLGDLPAELPARDLEAATDVLVRVAASMSTELLLVDPDALDPEPARPNRAARRRAGRSRRPSR